MSDRTEITAECLISRQIAIGPKLAFFQRVMIFAGAFLLFSGGITSSVAAANDTVTIAEFTVDGTGQIHPEAELAPSETYWSIACKKPLRDSQRFCEIQGRNLRSTAHFKIAVDASGQTTLTAGKQPQKNTTVQVKFDNGNGIDIPARTNLPLEKAHLIGLAQTKEIRVGWIPWGKEENTWQTWPSAGFATAMKTATAYATGQSYELPERIAAHLYFTMGRTYQQMEKTLLNPWCIRAFGDTDISKKKTQIRDDMRTWFDSGYRREFRSYTKCEVEQARVDHVDWKLANLTIIRPQIVAPVVEEPAPTKTTITTPSIDKSLPPIPDHKPLVATGRLNMPQKPNENTA